VYNPLTHSLVLRGMSALAMARAFLRYRNPRRRAIGAHHTAFYERVWREAATELGATFKSLGSGIVEIELDGVRTRAVENTSAIDDPVTITLLADKPLTYRILAQQSLPTPRHAVFSLKQINNAIAVLRDIARDCVVKPARGTGGGRGVTTGVRTPSQLARAAACAAVYGDHILIEEQIPGDNYRLLFLDGQLLDAFVRRHPTLVGDGHSTVAQLVRAANDDRSRHGAGKSQVLLTIDLDVRHTLARQNLSLRSIPAKDQSVTLKTVVNENLGADNTTATRLLCPAIVEQCATAVRTLGVRFAGVDVITTDPAAPLGSETGGVILEVNAPPNFYYHYNKSDARFPVARHVLRRLLIDNDPAAVPTWATATAAGALA